MLSAPAYPPPGAGHTLPEACTGCAENMTAANTKMTSNIQPMRERIFVTQVLNPLFCRVFIFLFSFVKLPNEYIFIKKHCQSAETPDHDYDTVIDQATLDRSEYEAEGEAVHLLCTIYLPFL
jgi:hypothetical protein